VAFVVQKDYQKKEKPKSSFWRSRTTATLEKPSWPSWLKKTISKKHQSACNLKKRGLEFDFKTSIPLNQ